VQVALRNGAKVDPTPDRFYSTPLHEIAEYSIEAVEFLLEHGVDVKKKDREWDTPFHRAARRGNTDVVRLFLERWLEGTMEKNVWGNTPLHLAVYCGRTEAVELSVESWPACKEVRNSHGQTPLYYLMTRGEV
jgi:ankyrin repeat protein